MHCLLCGAEEIIVYFVFDCKWSILAWDPDQIVLENVAYSHHTTVNNNLQELLKWQMENVGSIHSKIEKILLRVVFFLCSKPSVNHLF